MNILLINTYDLRGGAARATWRLFEGLQASGNQVNLLVQERRVEDAGVIVADSPVSSAFNPFRPYVDFAIPLIFTRKRVLFSTSMIPDRIPEMIERINPDVVHLNWITGGFIRIESLARIARPLLWTLHDMWAFTGGCHYTGDCNRYLEGCGKCPVLHSTRENDLSRQVFRRKAATYAAMKNLTITTPSSWLAEKVSGSPLLAGQRVVVVQNGLDTNLFRSPGRAESRKRLNLDSGKKIVLFGAIRGTENPLKGFSLLAGALKMLNRSDIQLLVFGSSSAGTTDVSGLNIRFFGQVNDQALLVDLYSAADVVAVPSLQEVFGQAATEAMACSTPVVAFDCTGLRDIVTHLETGYLAQPFTVEDLANGIRWVLEDKARNILLGENARVRATGVFNSSVVAEKMITLYQEAIHAGKV
jgi:glycosyltransferase involved in cell wall biosynthesis